jgi:hypothetical protein
MKQCNYTKTGRIAIITSAIAVTSTKLQMKEKVLFPLNLFAVLPKSENNIGRGGENIRVMTKMYLRIAIIKQNESAFVLMAATRNVMSSIQKREQMLHYGEELYPGMPSMPVRRQLESHLGDF